MAFNIGPRIGVEGEKELKEALKAIIAQFKTLDAEMKAMETAFKRGEMSQKGYTEYQTKAADAMGVLAKLTEEYAKWVDIAAAKHGESSSEAERYRTEIAKVSVEQENLKTRSRDAAKAQEELAEESEKTAEALSALETVLIEAGIIKGLEGLKEVLAECSRAAAEFETAMAAVSRTTGLDGMALDDMASSLKGLSTELPITANELANLVSDAGQLGIQTHELELFAETMAKIGTATEMTAQEAGALIAQFSNITGVREFDRLASMFVQLGDATATTATKTIEMSQAMAASASMAGLSAQAIAAISATVASLGIESQAGGTAISTLVQNIYKAVESGGKALEDFAAVAGMSAGEFKAAWGSDADSAFAAFISGLDDVEKNGQSAISLLEELEIKNIRQARAVLGLSQAEEQLAANMELANKAWNENAALGEKAAKMYDTTEGKFKTFENSINNLKIAIGNALNPALADMAESGGNAFQWAAEFVDKHPGIVDAITAVAVAMGALTATTGAAIGISKLTQGLALLKTTLAGLTGLAQGVAVFGGWAAAIAGVVTALELFRRNVYDSAYEAKNFIDTVEESADVFNEQKEALSANESEVENLIDSLSKLSDKENKTATDKKTIKELVDKLNTALPELALNYDETADAITRVGGSAKLTADDVLQLAQAMADEAEQEANIKRMADLLTQQADLQERLNAARKALAEETDFFSSVDNMKAVEEYSAALAGVNAEIDSLYGSMERSEEVATATGEDLTALNGILNDAQIQIDALAEEYTEAFNRIYESIRGVGGPLEELKANTELSTEAIGKNLDQQVVYWEEYGKNLDNLLARDIEGIEKLVEHFNDGSEDSAGALAALATATDDELRKMVEDLDKADEFKRGISGAFAEAEINAADRMQQIVNNTTSKILELNLSSQAYSAGMDTLQGYINGLNMKSSALYNRMYAIARQTIANMRAGLDSHSPSREFEDIGIDTILGYIKGVDEKAKTVMTKMREIARDAIATFNGEADGINPFELPDVDGITARMGGSLSSGSFGSTTNNKTLNLGGITITVNAAANQSPQQIAEAVMEAIQAEVDRKGAVFG